MNNEILLKVDEIINDIENSPIYQKYLLLKKEINNNKELMALINKVRLLQKDVVHHVKEKEELEILINELNNDPLYREYNNTLEEINNTYAIIQNSLNSYFQKIIN